MPFVIKGRFVVLEAERLMQVGKFVLKIHSKVRHHFYTYLLEVWPLPRVLFVLNLGNYSAPSRNCNKIVKYPAFKL